MEDETDLISLVRVRNGELEVDDNAVVKLLSLPGIQDRRLAIISIAGAFRTGKSFILNFFIRYLRAKGWSNPNWFGNPNTEISRGFPVKRGSEACTKGIHVWNEVFYIPQANGKQAAVLLVDTQGLFDGDTSPNTNARIMSISTLFSSHQILNLKGQVEERDLEHLQLCIEFAKVARKLPSCFGSQPFQTLTFLIRDWEREYEHVLGESTEGYLRHFLGKPSKSREVEKVRRSISEAFKEVDCFLICHPGKKVTRHDGIGLQNKEIDEEFQQFAKVFVEYVLDPKRIVFKKTPDGKFATASDLHDMIGTVGKAYKSGKVPTAQTMLMSVIQANNTKAIREGVLEYRSEMVKFCEGILSDSQLEEYNERAVEAAMKRFGEVATMGDDCSKKEFIVELEKECKQVLDSFTNKNQSKKEELKLTLKEHVDECLSNYRAAMKQVGFREPDAFFEAVHKENATKERTAFNQNSLLARTVMPEEVDQNEQKLNQEIDKSYQSFKATRKREKEILQRQLRGDSDRCMHKISMEFQTKVDKYGADYEANLPEILRELKNDYIGRYDKEMSGNTETQHVTNNRMNLNIQTEKIAKQAELVNENIRSAKKLKLQSEVSNRKSEYKGNMKKLGSDTSNDTFASMHQQYKQDALRKFADQGKGSPDVPELRKILEDEIDGIYKSLVKDRAQAAEMKQRQLRDECDRCKHKIYVKFQTTVVQYGADYEANLSEILGELEEKYMGEYDEEMLGNAETQHVKNNRSDLNIQCKQVVKQAMLTNENIRRAKESQLHTQLFNSKSEYKGNMELLGPNTSDDTFASQHQQYKQDALREFDDQGEGSPDAPELRKRLENEIDGIYQNLVTNRRDAAAMKQRQLKDDCDRCMHKICKEFRKKVDQHGADYTANLPEILRELKEEYMRKYDNEMLGNAETQNVAKNRTELSDELDGVVKQAKSTNESIRSGKKSQLHTALSNNKSEYKNGMERLGSDVSNDTFERKHKEYKQDALRKFDDQDGGSPDASKLRKRLEAEIDEIYDNLVKNRSNVARMKEKEKETKSQNSMNTMCRQFGDFADKLADSYHENLESTLENKKTESLRQYDTDMINNKEPYVRTNRTKLETELRKIITRATATNSHKREIARGEYEKTARDFADEFEESVETMLSKSYVEPSCLDKSQREFLNDNVYPSSEYKAMPEWGQHIVESEISNRLKTIKSQNESNKNYRATKVDKPNIVMRAAQYLVKKTRGALKSVGRKLRLKKKK